MNSRAIAATTLDFVLKNARPLDRVLTEILDNVDQQKERSFIQELCYGVMRWYPRLQFIADSLLEKPLKRKDSNVYLLLLLGIYQLDFMRTPEHAAVSATVDACPALKKTWAKQLINAVLRRYQREKSLLLEKVNDNRSACFAHPEWIIRQLEHDWPGQWTSLLETNNCYPPMHLRVNLLANSRAEYIERLRAGNIFAEPLDLAGSALRLLTPVPVEELPGFNNGDVSVQDQGAQLAVSLMKLEPGLRVLDACAAPGGKVSHVYETEPNLATLIAIDRDTNRTDLLRATQQRLGTKMQIIEADAGELDSWWDGERFDRILLDVPCSASGVIRRHPDIKMLRQAEQMTSLTESQAALLSRLWQVLADGGRMVYSTCSMFKQENDLQIEKHLERHGDASLSRIGADWGIETRFGRQTLPTLNDTDGFYYATLDKNRATQA